MLPSSPRLAQANDFKDLPIWLWLGLPLAYYLLVYGAALVMDQPAYYRFFTGEMCVTEILTVLILAVAVIAGILALRDLRALDDRLLLVWVALGTLGCFYFGGEEASWGQWYLRWTTPEAWQALNNQQETNLHNLETLGPLLDQLPRALLTLGAFVGGIVVPLVLKARQQWFDPRRRWYWIWPTAMTLPVAVIAVFLARIDRRIGDVVDQVWPYYDMRTGELKELFLGYFLMLYLLSLRLRLRQLRDSLNA
jgi:hypothetical protein